MPKAQTLRWAFFYLMFKLLNLTIFVICLDYLNIYNCYDVYFVNFTFKIMIFNGNYFLLNIVLML